MNTYSLGERLKHLRKKKEGKPRQEDVAASLGIPRATYANWEIDRGEPSAEDTKRLAEYFNTTTDFILGVTDDPSPPNEPDLEELMYLRLERSKLSKATKMQLLRAFRENLELIKQLEDEAD